ncbi:MAG: hypothetical protein A3I44_00325 [Candidatus Sungbacteria bacterium RIFCSPLOWO2_02_FULL_51_17]|uniref:Uncharacterized protein n=1 Tax=Candidatus Sungbacteria bacterium RIFCSPHIGHO2_02_FULL_51_29 TaxID=1802273 RepID=A0A1G2KPI2_9BACT|nr:MAG: hypothetical protein A2676_04710 [Candidatus Sungbacteria bacterium RIFCSPHIGHO2_01_FULL_51_22]OHA01293.1 MAG: hypothetical protein A3C16_01990 [Candidatus Sungbacteria bacterium RIFCSPHIGHO2_02_FULL_51_29]OHA06478.1 MAG: hypothetical protein A3B29_05465 [Candidatus Sungbacteria bacterium RIFCSPLOWO2_01_FULL_51_34]OHA12540.1 MAG: hypothetical protein A3I44_00325 [Candidatus Sungbacteria bacterium RIFCSPLOWO2_02_FULL_51_17]
MRKILSFFTFSGKAFLLILLLIVGWTFVNVSNLFKGGKSQKGDDVTGLFLPDDAHADATTTSCIVTTCPHVAVFDGHAFKIENDFFQKSFHTDYSVARSRYERGEMPPDLLRFGAVPRMRDGRIALQLQEIEPEESFIDKVQLMRVIHSMTSEIIPSNVSGKLYAFERADLEHTTALPSRAVLNAVSDVVTLFSDKKSFWNANDEQDPARFFKPKDEIEFTFQGLSPNEPALLVVQSFFRDWMIGEASRRSFLPSFVYSATAFRVGALVFGLVYLLSGRKHGGDLLSLAPLFMGSGSESAQCSILFYHQDASGRYALTTVHKSRDWRYGTEVIELPHEAVQENGTMKVKAVFTRKHKLNFIGAVQNAQEAPCVTEELAPLRAASSRLGDVFPELSENGRYVHMIPGDTVDVDFEDPQTPLRAKQQETYLMRSSGFYTALRPEYKKIAGNWSARISDEAREHYRDLASSVHA